MAVVGALRITALSPVAFPTTHKTYFPGLRFGYMIFSEEPKNGKMSIKNTQL